MRKLASIRRISDIQPIENADAIECAVVDGWKVVTKKGEYKSGDLAVYLEIDSWVPHELASFLSKGQQPREYNGVKGERLRTVKLRGQISQGLLLSLDSVKDALFFTLPKEGEDVTEVLGIQKWEAPISPQLAGQVRGQFPTHLIPKTDQERIQNCFEEIEDRKGATYEVTMKLDGTSCTIFRWEDELRVCSRNLELKVNDENAGNTLVSMAMKVQENLPDGFAFQGELMGPGIQGNRENFKEHRLFVFDIFDIREHRYLNSVERLKLTRECNLEHAPIIAMSWEAPESVEHGLELAEGESMNHKIREGLVWKCKTDSSFSFKTISNKFLLKGGD